MLKVKIDRIFSVWPRKRYSVEVWYKGPCDDFVKIIRYKNMQFKDYEIAVAVNALLAQVVDEWTRNK